MRVSPKAASCGAPNLATRVNTKKEALVWTLGAARQRGLTQEVFSHLLPLFHQHNSLSLPAYLASLPPYLPERGA
ncbi:hypothetical protein E2C01_093731 [Portunus trituberculatus]|uniref:Uncharacterized protein n=1 Tax=Portunus trituberculatus TaxID=210409 RepID=A0A5B7JV88_PORTR|nr:hypothetical protein [Portunus trituberculatus]